MLTDRGAKVDSSRLSVLDSAGTSAVEMTKALPEVRLTRWSGEADLSVTYATVKAAGTLTDERMTWGAGDGRVEAYALDPAIGMEDGGLEIEIHLEQIPATNRWNFTVLNADQFDWWFQPPLTQSQIDSGRHRPDNVVNSYAVYHKTKRNHIKGQTNYGTGKAFHVYRPKLIDAKGVETWGALEYAAGVLTVEIPQDALDTATYPAIVDPTFGHTSIAGSTYSVPNNTIEGTKGTPASDGTVDSVTVYVQGGPANMKAVMVLASTLNIIANGTSGAASLTGAPAWQTITYGTPPSVTASTAYYVSVIHEDEFTMYYDSTGAGNFEDTSNSYTTPTNPTDGTEVANERFSLYATYTEAGGADPEGSQIIGKLVGRGMLLDGILIQ